MANPLFAIALDRVGLCSNSNGSVGCNRPDDPSSSPVLRIFCGLLDFSVGAVALRPLFPPFLTVWMLPVEKRHVIAGPCCFRSSLLLLGGGLILLSDSLRGLRPFLTDGPDLGLRSTLIIAHATLSNAVAPTAPLRSRIAMTNQTNLWLSCINLPLRFKSRPWKSRPNPESNNSSFLFRQNEKLIRRSSRSWII